MTAQVIPFPKSPTKDLPTAEDINTTYDSSTRAIVAATDKLMNDLCISLTEMNIPVGQTVESAKDLAFVAESVRSMLSRVYERPHTIQPAADNSFLFDQEMGELLFVKPTYICISGFNSDAPALPDTEDDE